MGKYKQFFIGFLVGAMLFGSMTVFAENKDLRAFYNDIKISIDGQIIELKDAKGNKIEPFVAEGTTYAPVRAIAEGFNKEVAYNETTNTIVVSTKKEVGSMPASDTTAEKFYDENVLTTTLEDGIAYVNIKNIISDKTLRFEGYIKAVPSKNSDTVNIYKFTKGNGSLVLENVQVVNYKNDLYIPYDTYKADIQPKLQEAIMQNQ